MVKFLSVLLLVPAIALCQDSGEPKGHPFVPGFPGYGLNDAESHDFGAYDFKLPNEKTANVEGRYFHGSYSILEGKKVGSPLEIVRNYESAFKSKGGALVFKNVDMGGGEATLKMPRGGSEVWLGLEISNNGELYQMTVVERAAMEQKVELSAGDMADALKKSGRVALHGILFDTNKDTIQPASMPVLEEVKRLLDADPSLALVIEGHTDGTGTKDANLALSKKRAAAVKTWLTGRGVEARRLEEKGLGDGAPVGDNRTEEGRAQNRRVELVRKPS